MTTQSPLISVVIPAYNRRDTLDRTLRSVWLQDVDDIEVVIVDDGSIDGTREYLSELAERDARVRPILHERNKGEAGARNTGVKNARGEYIAFLDSDDEWLPGKLKAQIDMMRSSGEDVGACCTGQYVEYEDGSRESVCDWSVEYEITDLNLLTRGCGVGMGSTFVIRSDVFHDIGYYDEELPLLVDLDWLCRLTSKYRVLKINDLLIVYYKAKLRTGEVMEAGVKSFVNKNANYLRSFGFWDRLKINSVLNGYMATSYHQYGPWRDYIRTAFYSFLSMRYTPFRQYVYFGLVLLGVIRIGKSGR